MTISPDNQAAFTEILTIKKFLSKVLLLARTLFLPQITKEIAIAGVITETTSLVLYKMKRTLSKIQLSSFLRELSFSKPLMCRVFQQERILQ